MELKTVISFLELKHFRLFDQLQLNLDSPLVCIEGDNGSGKTSLLEAISFLGNMRSCKTTFVEHIIQQGHEAFFLKADLTSLDIVYVGVQQKKKIVKVNQKQLTSLVELHTYITPITVLDSDMLIVQGAPIERRQFLDTMLLLQDPGIITLFKKLSHVVKQRNELLQTHSQNETLISILSEQLTTVSKVIQQKRIALLMDIELLVNAYVQKMNLRIPPITLSYVTKVDCSLALDVLLVKLNALKHPEFRYGRSLYGAHLDDFNIQWGNQQSRTTCSRGQQKLIVLLLKISLICILKSQYKGTIVLLIDDFITDFDQFTGQAVAAILCSLPVQLICTCPIKGFLQTLFAHKILKTITL